MQSSLLDLWKFARETSLAVRSEERRLYSQATRKINVMKRKIKLGMQRRQYLNESMHNQILLRELRELVACVKMYALRVFLRRKGVCTVSQSRELDSVKGGLIALLHAVSCSNFTFKLPVNFQVDFRLINTKVNSKKKTKLCSLPLNSLHKHFERERKL